MMKQVILDNGHGQGSYGLGEDWETALKIAMDEYRANFGADPVRFRLCVSNSEGSWDLLEDGLYRSSPDLLGLAHRRTSIRAIQDLVAKSAGGLGLDAVAKGDCPTCGKKIGKFRDALSEKEFKISKMCQDCQDEVFPPTAKELNNE